MTAFKLDERLAADTMPVIELAECSLLLMNDARWPWLILVPKVPAATEWHDLPKETRNAIDLEIASVSSLLKKNSGAQKINIGMIGNMVPQLHVHVVAREQGDPNWPGPVWGYQERVPYSGGQAGKIISTLRAGLGYDAGI